MLFWEPGGVSEVDFHFLLFFSFQAIFFRNGKMLFLAKVIEFSNYENTYNYTARANFNRDLEKSTLKIYLLLQFLR